MKKPVQYIRCPRCELNWIQKKDKFCSVCKAEMKAIGNYDEFEETQDLDLCPICKLNYINDDEDMCPTCAKLHKKALLNDEEEKEDNWKTYTYEKEDVPESDYDEDLTVGNIDDEIDQSLEEDDDINLTIPLEEDDTSDDDDDDDDDEKDDDLDFDDDDDDSDDDDDDDE